jgi:hypothetical protein
MAETSESKTPEQLLLTRRSVARMLGNVDVSYVRRLERSGRLRAVRLSRSPSSMVFFRTEDVLALIAEAADDKA